MLNSGNVLEVVMMRLQAEVEVAVLITMVFGICF
jgi:hypothetical protein